MTGTPPSFTHRSSNNSRAISSRTEIVLSPHDVTEASADEHADELPSDYGFVYLNDDEDPLLGPSVIEGAQDAGEVPFIEKCTRCREVIEPGKDRWCVTCDQTFCPECSYDGGDDGDYCRDHKDDATTNEGE